MIIRQTTYLAILWMFKSERGDNSLRKFADYWSTYEGKKWSFYISGLEREFVFFSSIRYESDCLDWDIFQ